MLWPQGGPPPNPLLRQGSQLDLDGKGGEAREIFQRAIDTAPKRIPASVMANDGEAALFNKSPQQMLQEEHE